MRTNANRDHPMFFRGEQQSEEFARGAWAATDLAAEIDAHDPHKFTSAQVTAAMAGKFCDMVAHGSDEFQRGFMTALVEILAFSDIVGSPNFDVWRPLEMELCFRKDGAHPTPGSRLFEYAGFPVAIAPDETVYVWDCPGEAHPERSKRFLMSVTRRGKPLTQRSFAALTVRGKSATKKAMRSGKTPMQRDVTHG